MRDLTYSESRKADEQTLLAVHQAFGEKIPFTYHHAYRLHMDTPEGETLAPRDVALRTPFREYLPH